MSYLQTIDKSKRKEWKEIYASLRHPEDDVKNSIINNLHRICPGFKYLVDFEWKVSNRAKENLIFGSDFGVYLIIETRSFHTGSGRSRTAQVFRSNAKRRVK